MEAEPRAPGSPRVRVLARGASGVALVSGAGVLLEVMGTSLPVREWVAWDFATLWGWQLLFSVSCLSVGTWILERVVRLAVPPLEGVVLALAAGVGCFSFGIWAGGVLRILSPWFAVLLPVALLIVGLPSMLRALRSARGAGLPAGGWSPAGLGLAALGVLGAGLVYLQCMTPEALSFDSTWTHLSIAEDYAREGRIVGFPADLSKNLPHLASILYTWGFLVPGLRAAPLRWMMAQHLEFVLFLFTLLSVVPAVRWLLRRTGANGSWAAFFLFPGFFLVDSNLGAGSDHVAAFFALPLLLATLRAGEQGGARVCAFAGLLGGLALQTKYQCLYLVLPAFALLGGLAATRDGDVSRRDRAARAGTALGAFAAGVALGVGPHVIRNLVCFHNPVYPLLQGVFRGSTPTFPDAPEIMRHLYGAPDRGESGLWARLLGSAELAVTFSFAVQFTLFGTTPYFGSLFTVFTPVALLQRTHRRLWLGVGLGYAALFLWAFSYRIDRNLQVILPWLVAATAATIAVAWGSGWPMRTAAVLAIGAQIAWGLPAMVAGGMPRVLDALRFVRTGMTPGTFTSRYDRFRADFRALGDALPPDATLLLHTWHTRLGIDRRTLADWAGWQFAIDYRLMKTERDVYERYRALGITHLVWNGSDVPASKQEDVLFVAFTRRYAVQIPSHTTATLWRMPDHAPPGRAPLRVLMLGIAGYRDGLYSIEQLGTFDGYPSADKHYPGPRLAAGSPAEVERAARSADAAVVEDGVTPGAASFSCFERAVSYRAGFSVFLRRQTVACERG